MVLDKSGTYEADCIREVVSGRKVVDAIRSLVELQFECTRAFHE